MKLRNAIASAIAVIVSTILATVFIPDAINTESQSLREFAALFIVEWNDLNHGNFCELVATEIRGGSAEDCARYATVADGSVLLLDPIARPRFELRNEKHAKVLIKEHNVYSVPVKDLNQKLLAYIDIQRDKSGTWKALRLRIP